MAEERAEYNPANKMIKLSGKEYLQVADRIVWFRNDYPEGTIETTIVSIDEERGSAIYRARVGTGQGGVAEATGDETRQDFPQGWIGKAETKAVGRALGYLGYGTAAAGFEEGRRVVDAPQAPRRADAQRPASAQGARSGPSQTQPAASAPLGPGVPENIMTHSMDMAWRKFAEGESADAAKAVLRRLWSQADQRDRDFILSEITKLDADEAARNAALDTPAPVAPSYASIAG